MLCQLHNRLYSVLFLTPGVVSITKQAVLCAVTYSWRCVNYKTGCALCCYSRLVLCQLPNRLYSVLLLTPVVVSIAQQLYFVLLLTPGIVSIIQQAVLFAVTNAWCCVNYTTDGTLFCYLRLLLCQLYNRKYYVLLLTLCVV